MHFDLLAAGMELKKQFGNDARLELICEDFGFSIQIKLLHSGKIWNSQFSITHAEIAAADKRLFNFKFAEAIYEIQRATGCGRIKWRCEGCGTYLETEEVEPYGDGFCHVVPVYNQRYEDFDPEPCGPVTKEST